MFITKHLSPCLCQFSSMAILQRSLDILSMQLLELLLAWPNGSISRIWIIIVWTSSKYLVLNYLVLGGAREHRHQLNWLNTWSKKAKATLLLDLFSNKTSSIHLENLSTIITSTYSLCHIVNGDGLAKSRLHQ